MSKIIRRELEVMFSKRSQPIWFRIAKWLVIITICYFCWGMRWFWLGVVIAMILALTLHFWYRYKTNGWTKSFRGWKLDKDESDVDATKDENSL
jgi:hypothetical protein